MNPSRTLKKSHYGLIVALAMVSVLGGIYCGSMGLMLLGLVCTAIQLTCFSVVTSNTPLRDRLVNGRWRGLIILFAAALSFVGFLYMIDEIANDMAGSPRYPMAAAGCGLFAMGLAIWLVMATCARSQKDSEKRNKNRFVSTETVASVVLLATLVSLSGALRSAAIFQPTALVVYGCFPWQDETFSYGNLTNARPIAFVQRDRKNRATVQEAGTRLSFSDGATFDLGPSWRWRCPRDKEIVDNRIMALLRPYLTRRETDKAASHVVASQITQEPKDYGLNDQDPIDVQIANLERELNAHPVPFDSYGHNLLRHLYMATDERKAMEQCDLIFQHSFMDEYTLECLGDWKLDTDPLMAVQNLLKVERHYPDLKYLHAACTLEIARLYKEQNHLPDAMHYMASLQNERDHDLSAYRQAAERISD